MDAFNDLFTFFQATLLLAFFLKRDIPSSTKVTMMEANQPQADVVVKPMLVAPTVRAVGSANITYFLFKCIRLQRSTKNVFFPYSISLYRQSLVVSSSLPPPFPRGLPLCFREKHQHEGWPRAADETEATAKKRKVRMGNSPPKKQTKNIIHLPKVDSGGRPGGFFQEGREPAE